MIIIEFKNDSMGFPIADHKAYQSAITVIDRMKDRLENGGDDYTLAVSTENILYAFRVAVKRGLLDCKHIKFRFEDQDIFIDKRGRFITRPLPKGFSDFIDNMLDVLIDVSE